MSSTSPKFGNPSWVRMRSALMSVKTGLVKDGPPATVYAFWSVAPSAMVEEYPAAVVPDLLIPSS